MHFAQCAKPTFTFTITNAFAKTRTVHGPATIAKKLPSSDFRFRFYLNLEELSLTRLT